MALAGTGAIIIWNDITPEGRADFYDWHVQEHIPERMAIPGFLRGSRYCAIAGTGTTPEYLTLYETQSPAVATSAPYLARLNAPTGWTKRATSHFRNTSRALTEVVHSRGAGQGGMMCTIRFNGDESSIAALERVRACAGETFSMFKDIANMTRIAGLHLCATNTGASAATTAESRERTDLLAAPIGAVLIEGADLDAVSAAMARLQQQCALIPGQQTTGFYRLEHTRANSST